MSSEGHGKGENRENMSRPRRQSGFPSIGHEEVTLKEKVVFPVDEYPGYNFIGKLLGPKGSTLKGLVLSTKTRISILGKGSSKDKRKEDELMKSDDPEHAHYKEPLHVLVQVSAHKINAHRRMAEVLQKLNYYMVPQSDDRPQQMEERPALNEPEVARHGGRERAPIIRVGIPPPGAVILGEVPLRGESRHVGRDPLHDPYDQDDYYESRRSTDYDRYPEPQDPQRYDYTADRDSYRRAEKRSIPPSNVYSPKRYQEDIHNDPYSR